jgi:hypothetical protein
MSAGERYTFWFRVDPEEDRRRLIERVGQYVNWTGNVIAQADETLRQQGYRIHPEDFEAMTAMIDRFRERLERQVRRARIEHIGPPQGKVAPPEVEAAFRADPMRKTAVVTKDDDAPVTTRSRSRH